MNPLTAAVRKSQPMPMKAKRPWGASPRAEIALSPIRPCPLQRAVLVAVTNNRSTNGIGRMVA
jgi:hypothetical protein